MNFVFHRDALKHMLSKNVIGICFLFYLFTSVNANGQTETVNPGLWSQSFNWNNGVPTNTINATINHEMIIDAEIYVSHPSQKRTFLFNAFVIDTVGGSEYALIAGKNGVLDFEADASFEGIIRLSGNAQLIIGKGVTLTVGGFASVGNPNIFLDTDARLVVLGGFTFISGFTPDLQDSVILCKEDSLKHISLRDIVGDEGGNNVTYTIDSSPFHGAVSSFDEIIGTFDYMPNLNFNGRDSVHFSACVNSSCTSGFLILKVAPVNDRPIAISDTANYLPDQRVVLGNVLTNDYDIDGDRIVVVAQQNLTTPKGGALVIDANGNYSYTRPYELTAIDSILYTIDDGFGGTDSSYLIFRIQAHKFISEGFSPNGDTENPTWIINVPTGSPKISVIVYNRWGNAVFEADNYQNDWNGASNQGLYVGKIVPDDTYFYVVDFNDGQQARSGYITIRH